LFTTPIVYLYLDRLSNWLQGAKHGEEVETVAPPERVRPAA
jgi:HAE1 family hydrophobic/amphiphilic exporter-1